MKNIEKYEQTEDAVKAWNEYSSGKGIYLCLDDWLKEEYVEPHEPTLLEAAEAVAKAWNSDGHNGILAVIANKIGVLSDAVVREKAKPVRNFDKYKTSKKACDGFNEMCKGVETCVNCRFNSNGSIAGCAIAWLYSEAEKAR